MNVKIAPPMLQTNVTRRKLYRHNQISKNTRISETNAAQ